MYGTYKLLASFTIEPNKHIRMNRLRILGFGVFFVTNILAMRSLFISCGDPGDLLKSILIIDSIFLPFIAPIFFHNHVVSILQKKEPEPIVICEGGNDIEVIVCYILVFAFMGIVTAPFPIIWILDDIVLFGLWLLSKILIADAKQDEKSQKDKLKQLADK